jgi:hypothetical protein
MRHTYILALLASSVILTACGGGGSETPPPTPVVQQAPPTPAPQATDDRKKVWTFAVGREVVATTIGGEYPSRIGDFFVADFNGDGINDILIGGGTWDNDSGADDWSGKPARYEVLRGTDAGFEQDTEMLFGNYDPEMIMPVDFLVHDYDGNGTLDIVVAGTGLDKAHGAGDKAELWINNGQLPLVNQSTDLNFNETLFTHSATKGDFNGDSFTDVSLWQCCVVPNVSFQESSGATLINDGNGVFEHVKEYVPAEFDPEYIRARMENTGSWAVIDSLAIDLNGSGCDDLVIGAVGSVHPSQILWNHCEGSLSKPVLTADEVSETTVLPDDGEWVQILGIMEYPVNGDEHKDLLVLRSTYEGEGMHLQLLRNNGDNTFTDVSENSTIEPYTYIPTDQNRLFDFDGDGYLDISFIDAVYRGTATGLEKVELDINQFYGAVFPIDVDNDGDVDLVHRNILDSTFGFSNQEVSYTVLENLSN